MAELPCIVYHSSFRSHLLRVVPSHFHHCVLFMGTWWFIVCTCTWSGISGFKIKKRLTSLSRARGARRSAGRTWNRKMPLPRAAARGLAMKVRTWSWKSKFQWCQQRPQNASCMFMWIYVNQTCQEVSQLLRTLELHFSCLTPGDKASSSSSEVSADVPDRLLDAFFSQFNSGFLRNSQRIKSFGHIFCNPNSHFRWQFGFTSEGLIHLFSPGTWIQQPLVVPPTDLARS